MSANYHAPGCNTERRGCMPDCDNYDPKYDSPTGKDERVTLRQQLDSLGPTLPLAVLHQKARERIAELEAELGRIDALRKEKVRLQNWVAWLEREPEVQRT